MPKPNLCALVARLAQMKTASITIETGHERRIVDLTGEVRAFVTQASGGGDGLVNVSLPHATAGLVVMELGSGSEQDLLERIDSLFPRDDRYLHSHGSKGHGVDHILPAFISPTLTLPVLAGRVSLGTWQSIALIDTNVDNPQRDVSMAFMPG